LNKLPISASDLVGQLTTATSQLDLSTGGSYLRLHKGGFWVYGSDDTEVEEESHWAVNPASFALGFVAWPEGETGAPLGEEMRGISQQAMVKSELTPVEGGEWVQQVGMQLMCVSGEDVGTEVVFKASSKGGVGGFNDFLNQVLIHLKANAGTEDVVPVVDLQVKSYKHPKYGKIYTPVFHIVSWANMDEMPDDAEVEEEEEAPPAKEKVVKKKARKKAIAPPVEVEEEEEIEEEEETEVEEAPKPKRRRRRSAK